MRRSRPILQRRSSNLEVVSIEKKLIYLRQNTAKLTRQKDKKREEIKFQGRMIIRVRRRMKFIVKWSRGGNKHHRSGRGHTCSPQISSVLISSHLRCKYEKNQVTLKRF